MQRDWELVRAILLALAAQPDLAGRIAARNLPDWPAAEVNYHLWLLIEAALVVGRASGAPGTGDALSAYATALTWKGQELLAAIKSESAWTRIRRELASRAVDLSFQSILTAAAALLH